jgi:hypothetical protein
MALSPGTSIGHYEILQALGAGDFADRATFIARRVSWSPDGHSRR